MLSMTFNYGGETLARLAAFLLVDLRSSYDARQTSGIARRISDLRRQCALWLV